MYKAAEAMGVYVDKSIPFRDSLESGWLTAEIYTEAMQNMANDTSLTKAASEVTSFTKLMGTLKEQVGSGWAQSFENIFGDKEESTKLWTGISESLGNLITNSADARNKILKDWKDLGGRDDVIKGFTNIFQSLGKGFRSVGEAWNEVFPSLSGEKLAELSAKFKDFTENFKMGDETASKLKNTFKGVFTVFDTVKDAVVGVVKGFTPLLGIIKPIGSGFLTVTSSIGSFVSKIGEAADKSKIFDKMGNGIKTAFEAVGSALSAAGSKVSEFISKVNIGNAFDNVGKVFSKVGEIISKVASGIGQAIGSINFETITNIGKTLVGAGIFTALKSVFDKFKGIGDDLTGVFDSFKGIGEGVAGVLDSVKDSLTSWQNSLNAGTLIKLASAIGILAAALVALSTIETGDLATALAGMAVVFAELTLAMAAINKIGNIKGLTKTSASMNLMATAMLIMAGALKTLSSISIGEMATGLVGLAASLAVMVAAVKLFSTTSSGLAKTSASLIVFGAALKVMASAIEQMGGIDAETLGAGLFGLAGALTELALFLAAAKFGNLSMSSATGILILSAALVVLSQAMEQFGEMETDNIIRGLVGIAAVLTEIAVFAKLGGSGLQMTTLAIGLTAMSAAMLLLSQAVKSMGSISWEGIARGLTSLAGALTILGVASALVSGVQMTLLAVGLGAMSVALMGLSTALNMMSGQSWEEIGKSMVTLAGSLTILAVAMYAMTGCLPGAAAMLVMAAAMAVFTPQLIALSQLSLAQIGTGLLALAGAFAVVGVAGAVLGVISPLLLAFAAAVALVGVGVAAAGAGMLAFGTGITAVAAAVGTSGAVMISFAKELIELLPQIGLKAGEAMINFLRAVNEGAPQITKAFTTLMESILTAIQTNIPLIVQTAVDIVVKFAAALADGVPKIVESGIKMVKGILDGIARNIQGVVESGIKCVVAFINGVANKLPAVIQAAINLALSFIEGVADGLMSNQARLESAISKIIQAMIKTGISVIKGGISGFTSGGKELLQGLCNGIKSMASAAGTAVTNCINAAKRAASNLGSSLVSAGKSLIQGLVNGITSMASTVAAKAKSVVEGAINAAKRALKINSPSKVFIEIGKFVDEGFIVGMERYASKVANTAGDISKNVIDSFSKPLSKVNELIISDVISNPVITPVLDLSNVQANSRRLNNMLPGSGNINLSTDAANVMTNTMGKVQNGTSNGEIVAALNELKDNMVGGTSTSYTINGITYDNGSSIASAVEALVRAARIERRV
jgi:phage-related protein